MFFHLLSDRHCSFNLIRNGFTKSTSQEHLSVNIYPLLRIRRRFSRESHPCSSRARYAQRIRIPICDLYHDRFGMQRALLQVTSTVSYDLLPKGLCSGYHLPSIWRSDSELILLCISSQSLKCVSLLSSFHVVFICRVLTC